MIAGKNIKRNSYNCGTNTPLLRGLPNIIFCAYFLTNMMEHIIGLNLWNFIGCMLIFSSHLVSIIYHCIYLPEYEPLIRKIDHVFVHFHIFGGFLVLCNLNNIYHMITFLYLLCSTVYASYKLLFDDKYLLSTTYFIIAVSNGIFTCASNYMFSLISPAQNILLFVIFLIAVTTYVYNIFYVKNEHHIMSLHEAYHIFASVGDILMILMV